MLLPMALRQLTPGGVRGLARPGGVLVLITRRAMMLRLGRNGPYKWYPTFADLIADDWEFVDLRELREGGSADGAS